MTRLGKRFACLSHHFTNEVVDGIAVLKPCADIDARHEQYTPTIDMDAHFLSEGLHGYPVGSCYHLLEWNGPTPR